VELRPDHRAGGWSQGDRPIRVDLLTYAPTIFTHCQHCEVAFGQVGIGERLRREQVRESLPAELRAEFAAVADWVHALRERHGARIDVRVIDATSIRGIWTSLRYRTRRYPAVIVEGEERFVGDRVSLAEAEIERRIVGRRGRAEPSDAEEGGREP
jgi:hypothetical protein